MTAQETAQTGKRASVAKPGRPRKAGQKPARPAKGRAADKSEGIGAKGAPSISTPIEPERGDTPLSVARKVLMEMPPRERMKMPQHLDAPQKRKTPIKITPEMMDEIFHLMSLGKTVRSICRMPDMPSMSSVYRYWEACDPATRDRLVRAKEMQIQSWAEECIDLADDPTGDYVEVERRDGRKEMTFNAENVHRSRLRVDARKWLISKLKPERYGEKVTVDSNVTVTKVEDGDPVSVLNAARLMAYRIQRGVDTLETIGPAAAKLLDLQALPASEGASHG